MISGLIVCITLLGLAMQVLPDASIDEAIKTWVRYGSIAVLTLLLVQAIGLIWLCRSRSTEPQDLRSRLLRELQFEVNKRLQDSLTDSVLIPLNYEEKPETVGNAPKRNLVPAEESAEPQNWLSRLNPVRLLKRRGQPTIELPPEETMLDVFERVDRKLLILGEPGSGKTITLLTLAQELIQKAIDDPTQPIPVIFELSNWKQDSQSIAAWLVEQLGDRVSQKTAKQWLEAGQVLPLLDGLDELLDRQKKGTEAINHFVKGNLGADLVVCCRNEEFLQAGVILEELKSSVCLRPLSNPQIEGYFDQMQRPGIWQRIQQEAGLRQLLEPDANGNTGMLRIPLFLKMMLEVEPQGKLPICNRQDLLNAYIVYRLDPETIKQDRSQTRRHEWAFAPGKQPSQETTRRYLVWLAKKLQGNNETEFLIEKMQPTLLESPRQKLQYGILFRLIFRLACGLFFGLSFGMTAGIIMGLIVSNVLSVFFHPIIAVFAFLVVWLVVWLIVELNLNKALDEILSIDKIYLIESFTISRAKLTALPIQLFCILVIALPFTENIVKFFRQNFPDSEGLLFFCLVGLIFALVIELKTELKIRKKPNQGIEETFKNLWVVALVSYMILFTWRQASLISRGQVFTLEDTIFIGFLSYLNGLYLGGGLACTQHFALRLILWKNRRIPWNYARFLRYAAERRLIQQIGGRYRFLHRELLEHFAQMPHS